MADTGFFEVIKADGCVLLRESRVLHLKLDGVNNGRHLDMEDKRLRKWRLIWIAHC